MSSSSSTSDSDTCDSLELQQVDLIEDGNIQGYMFEPRVDSSASDDDSLSSVSDSSSENEQDRLKRYDW